MTTPRLLLLSLSCLTSSVSLVNAASSRPNFVFILTDDMREDDIAYMPNVNALVAAQGTAFHNQFCNVALCCPSRATILRGQYSHNTGITKNSGPNGGVNAFNARGLQQSTISTWLQSSGYRTALIGKYLNDYVGTTAADIPPGWSEWYAGNSSACYNNFNYTLNENGTVKNYGATAADYGTDVYAGKAIDFIQRSAATDAPFFVYLAPFSPHAPANAAPRDVGAHAGALAPRNANFNEANVSDKPSDIQVLPVLTSAQIADLDTLYAKRLDCLLSVDKMVGDIVQVLQTLGQIDNTYIIFTSDNGFHLGSHRMQAGKWTPYEEDTPVPLVIRGPGVPKREIKYITGNVDLAPTMADLAGVAIPDFVDGRSLAPLFAAVIPSESNWRQAFLTEHAFVANPSPTYPCSNYSGLHTKEHDYSEYANGDRELYDLARDPYEIANLAAVPAAATTVTTLSARLAQMTTGGGAAFRAVEEAPLGVR